MIPAGDVMKILAVILLFLIISVEECSQLYNPTSSLWNERQMQDDQRIHGNPYQSTVQFQTVWVPIPY